MLTKCGRRRLAGAPITADMLMTAEREEVCGPGYGDGLSDLAQIADEVRAVRGLLADYFADRMGEEACAIQ